MAYWRRRVVEACIYGVDLNPLAVELAKLSLWLTTISSDKPLNFLDHHLRFGNSLIGARLDQLGSLPAKKGRARPPGTPTQIQFTFGPDFKRVVAETLGQINEIESQASSDVTQVKAKEKCWEIEVLPRLAPYKKVADLWTNAFFDGPLSEEKYWPQPRQFWWRLRRARTVYRKRQRSTTSRNLINHISTGNLNSLKCFSTKTVRTEKTQALMQ